MSKELTMHLVIGSAAVAVLYYLYTRLKPTAATPQSLLGALVFPPSTVTDQAGATTVDDYTGYGPTNFPIPL